MSAMHMTLADWRRLYRLGRDRLQSEDSYRDFQVFQGSLLARFLSGNGIRLERSSVADIGCGIGGFSLALVAEGSRVTAVDLFSDRWPTVLAQATAVVAADALSLPLCSAAFDLVICASLVEHISRPDRLLAELTRITRPGGFVYLSFPPFYSPRGGHQLSPFHYLGERCAILVSRRLRGQGRTDWEQTSWSEPASFDALWGEWGLHVMTIGKFEGLLRQTSLKMRNRSTRLLPIDFSGLPVLREVLTWHVQYLLERPLEV